MGAKINNRCMHLYDGLTRFIKYEHGNAIILPIMGTKSKLVVCEECYRRMMAGERVEVEVKMRQPLRWARIAPNNPEGELFPEVILDFPDP